jgi:hypothetical protein
VTEQLAYTPSGAPTRGPRALIFETGSPESRCFEAPPLDVPAGSLDEMLGGRERTSAPRLPHVSETEIATTRIWRP